MPRRKPTAIYRHLLADAWNRAWRRKELWVFGLLAAIVSTGGVVEVSARSLRRMKAGGSLLERLLSGAFSGADGFAAYLRLLRTQSVTRVSVTLTLLTLLGMALLAAAIYAQGALVKGLAPKKAGGFRQVLEGAKGHFWSIFLLDAFAKAVSAVLMLSATLPLVLVFARGTAADALLYVAVFLVFFPAIIAVNVVSTLALVDIVKRGSRTSDAVHAGLAIFARHWLAALELGVILFVLVALAALVTLSGIVLLAIPQAALTSLAVLAGSPAAFYLVSAFSLITAALIVGLFIGAGVTYQHAAWVVFYEKATHRSMGGRALAKIERMFHT